MHRQTRGERHPQELGVELGRVQPTNVHTHRAAAVEVGPDVVALLRMGNGVRFDRKFLRQSLGAAGHLLVLLVSEGPFEKADQLEVAVELFRSDEIVKELARDLALGLDRHGFRFAEAPGDGRVVQPDTPARNSAIAR
jgi:hypothetical protein